MTPDEWIAAGAKIDEMRSKGFFMAVWSPGAVTNGRTFFTYPDWRVHFQRGAQLDAPVMDAEGIGQGDTFLSAVTAAYDLALADLVSWEQDARKGHGVE
jgi:hypothetical protein